MILVTSPAAKLTLNEPVPAAALIVVIFGPTSSEFLATEKPLRPSVVLSICFRSMEMVSPSLAPTWTDSLLLPARTLTPLKSVCCDVRSISDRRWLISS
ncbi:hypothetical protein D3C87_1796320 [compost metagenome]